MRKKILKKLLQLAITIAVFQVNAQKITFTTDLEGFAIGFGNNGSVTHAPNEGVTNDGALKLVRTTNNANFGKKPTPGINATTTKFVKVVFKNETAGTVLRIGGKNGDGDAIKTNEGGNIDLSISANSDKYVTKYIDLSTYSLWKGELQDLLMYVRLNSGNDPVDSAFYLDEIEFLESLPPATYSEFIKNPSFDDVVGDIDHITGNTDEYTRSIDNTVSKDGANSFKMAFDKVQPTKINWNFTNYTHTHTSTILENSVIEVKMWVKTNRTGTTAPFRVAQRTKTLLDGVDVRDDEGEFLIDFQTTTNTVGEWEELTFTYTAPGDFNQSLFWFAVDFEEGSDINMNLNDIVWFDQMSVTISDPSTASVNNNTLEGVNVYPNPATDNLKIQTLEGGKISLFNILGARVLSETTSLKNHSINVLNIETGLYILKVESQGKTFTKKLVIK